MAAKKKYHPQPSQNIQNDTPYQVRVKVFGVGGGGGNAIARMAEHLSPRSIELIAVNTDMQELEKGRVRKKIHIGKNLTRGLGTGMNPELGRQAAEENRSEIVEVAKGTDLVFITAGLGGGTGSGAAPVVADIAKENGALTVAIVTRPFTFEGTQRARVADEALMRLRERVDALIVVPNDRVFNVIKKDTPSHKALEKIDEILRDAINGITELITSTGIINVDFSDVRAIMREAGSAIIGVGVATGPNRALEAANLALNSPLLDFSVEGARGVLFGISGGRDMKMTEINDIAKTITATIDPSAKIIFGAYQDRKLKAGNIKVTLIATGFSGTVSKSSPELLNMASLFGEATATEAKTPTAPAAKEKEHEKEKEKVRTSFKDMLKKPTPVPLKEVKTKEDKKEFKLPGQQPTTKAAPANPPADTWEIPAFLRKKRRES